MPGYEFGASREGSGSTLVQRTGILAHPVEAIRRVWFSEGLPITGIPGSIQVSVCGHEEHADVNAEKNILTVGRTGLVCGSNRISGRKQEPAGTREIVLPRAS